MSPVGRRQPSSDATLRPSDSGHPTVKMAALGSWALWGFCSRGWSRAVSGCRLPGLRSSSPRGPLGARLLSQEKEATETHFGFETVSEEEKRGKGERGERVNGEDLTVYDLVSSAQIKG